MVLSEKRRLEQRLYLMRTGGDQHRLAHSGEENGCICKIHGIPKESQLFLSSLLDTTFDGQLK